MRPVLFSLPLPGGLGVNVHAYGLFLMVGMVLAVWASRRHCGRLGITTRQVFDLGLLLIASGVVGAHLLHAALNPGTYFSGGGWTEGLLRVAAVWRGGLVYYGGLVGGLAGLAIWARVRRVPLADAMDFAAPLGALGLASTRIGCFLTGCCYGAPSTLPWAVTYPLGSPAQRSQEALGMVQAGAPTLPIHPVQLYELAAAGCMFWWLWRLFPRRRFAGEGVALFGMAYGSWRFAAEFLRADSSGWTPEVAEVTVYQWMSLGLVAVSVAGWEWARRTDRRPLDRRL
jgi:phosphatidylglycerol:prolipoprotein diacylglycerol transferase